MVNEERLTKQTLADLEKNWSWLEDMYFNQGMDSLAVMTPSVLAMALMADPEGTVGIFKRLVAITMVEVQKRRQERQQKTEQN